VINGEAASSGRQLPEIFVLIDVRSLGVNITAAASVQ